LKAGRIEQVGAPIDLYRRPANTFVAGFLGAPRINLIPATVATVEGSSVELTGPGDARITANARPGTARAGDKVKLGLRPEMVTPANDGPLQGTVDVVEQLGAMQLVYATLPDGTSIVAELRDGIAPALGSTARFAIAPGIRHIFDAGGIAITDHREGDA
jgi:multiple sugar transport system ATP-binding protein